MTMATPQRLDWTELVRHLGHEVEVTSDEPSQEGLGVIGVTDLPREVRITCETCGAVLGRVVESSQRVRQQVLRTMHDEIDAETRDMQRAREDERRGEH